MCVQSASASDYKGMPTGSQVTLGYNSARINEATGNFQAAATEYKNILEAFPGRPNFCFLVMISLAALWLTCAPVALTAGLCVQT